MKLFETLKSLKKEDGYRYCVISDMKVANELLGKIYLSDYTKLLNILYKQKQQTRPDVQQCQAQILELLLCGGWSM